MAWTLARIEKYALSRTRKHALLAKAVLVWGLLVGATADVYAQYVPPKAFCLSSTGVCFDSLDKAEDALRVGSVYGALIRRKDIHQFTSTSYFYYEVPDQPASKFYDPVYRVPKVESGVANCPNSDPHHTGSHGDGCNDLGAAIQLWMASLGNTELWGTSCQVSGAHEVRGQAYNVNSYLAEYGHNNWSYPSWGDLTYSQAYGAGRGQLGSDATNLGANQYRVVAPINCPNDSSQKIVYASIDMHMSFDCPANFYALHGVSRTQSDVKREKFCRASNGLPYITGPIKQVASCPANRNPCHPATGDKSRAETDFQFAGRPFTRYYHSLKEYADRGFGIGWTHTYSETVFDAYGNFYLVNADGTHEAIKPVSGNLYRPENSSDRLIERFSTGTVRYKLTSASGEVREFNAQGRLVAIRNPANPQSDVTLTYAGTLLAKVTDAAGRAISFVYEDGLIAGAGLPDGASIAYGYDADRNLIAADLGDGQIKQYHYTESDLSLPLFKNHLTGITSEDGQRYASFSYDAYGRVTSSRLHAAEGTVDHTTLAYTTANTVDVTTPSLGSKSYTIQPGIYRRILSISDAQGTRSTTYHPDGRVATVTDAKGTVTSYEYPTLTTASETRAVGTTSQARTEVDRSAATNLIVERRTYDAVGTLVRREIWTHNSRGQVLNHSVVDF